MTDARKAIDRHVETITARDLKGYAATLHDDVVLVLPTGTTLAGKEAVVGFHQEFFADPDWTQDLAERTMTVGEHTARALFEADYRDVDAAGEPVRKRYLVGLVFTRVGEEWLLLHDQCTPV
ncbi:YybH family protein [Actinophytocola sp.]|uniref:YybH family protein n=1 Tax=Actinophytocola sp. TaxID=1872138 RepID=UPI003D6B0E4A